MTTMKDDLDEYADDYVDDDADDLVPLGDVLAALDEERAAVTRRQMLTAEVDVSSPDYVVEAERALLSIVMTDPDALDRIEVKVSGDDFWRRQFGVIWRVCAQLHAEGKVTNALVVVAALHRARKLDAVGGSPAVSQIEALMAPFSMLDTAARQVVDAARQRAVDTICQQAVIRVRAGREPAGVVVHETVARLERAVDDASNSSGLVDVADTVRRVHLMMPSNGGVRPCISSGFLDLDRVLGGGLMPGELILLAARPSMGKTALALNIMANMSIRQRMPTGMFSLEMTGDQLVERVIASEARLDTKKLELSNAEHTRLSFALGAVSESVMKIDQTPTMSIGVMRAKARMLHRKHGIRALFVDYLQLADGNDDDDKKNEQVAEVSKGLKGIARELNIPVVAVSQLSRANEGRQDKRPMLSDLRDSGALEQDADVVAFLFRLEYYMRDKTPENMKGLAEVIVAKNRNGPTGQEKLKFTDNCTRFDNYAEDE